MKTILGLLLIIGLIFALTAPGRAVMALCEAHPAGTPAADVEQIAEPFLVSRVGPIRDPKRPGVETVTFCTVTSMCDTSCRLTIEDGFVVAADSTAL